MFMKKILFFAGATVVSAAFNAQAPLDDIDIDGCDGDIMCKINNTISSMFKSNKTDGDSDDGMCMAPGPSDAGMCDAGMCGMEPPKQACCGMCAGKCGGAGNKAPMADDSDDSDL